MTVRCPMCKKEAPWEDNPHRPFCGERCKMRDLGAWAAGQYLIPGKPLVDEPQDEGADKGED